MAKLDDRIEMKPEVGLEVTVEEVMNIKGCCGGWKAGILCYEYA